MVMKLMVNVVTNGIQHYDGYNHISGGVMSRVSKEWGKILIRDNILVPRESRDRREEGVTTHTRSSEIITRSSDNQCLIERIIRNARDLVLSRDSE